MKRQTLDWAALRERSLQPGGFGEDRLRLWPQLLNVTPSNKNKSEADEADTPHPDERQIELDTDRSFVLYPVGETHDKDALQSSLHTLLVALFRKRPKLSYFQGYHDIVTVLYLTLPPELQLPCVEKLSLHRVRDSMGAGLEPVLGLLRVTQNLLHLADPTYAQILSQTSPLPFFALSNLLTLFAHDVPTLAHIQHIFDYLLCRPPVWVVYLVVAIILARKEEVLRLEEEGEEGMIHSLLSSLPALIDGDDDNEDEELENHDESGNDEFVLPTRRLFGEEGDARLLEKTKAGSSQDGKTNGISTPRKRYELRRFGGSDDEVRDGEIEASTDEIKEDEITGDQSDTAGWPLASSSPSTSPTLSPSTTETLLSTPTLSPSRTPALSFSTSPTLSSSSPPPSTPGLTLDLLDEDPSTSDGKGDDRQPFCTEEAAAFDLKTVQLIRPASESGEAPLPTSGTKQATSFTTGTTQATSCSSESGEATVPISGIEEAMTSISGIGTVSESEETTIPVLGSGQAMASVSGAVETTHFTSGIGGIGETLMHGNNTKVTQNDAENTDCPRRKQLDTEVSPRPIYLPPESVNPPNLKPSASSSKLNLARSSGPHVESSPTVPPKKRHAFKPKLSLPLLLSQADALAARFPPSDAGLRLSSIMGPQSVVYTFSMSPSALPSDDEAEAMVRNPGLVVYPQMPFGVEEEESAESEGEGERGGRKGERGNSREKGRGRRQKIKERIGEKRRRPARRPQTSTVVAGAVVVLGVGMAVYGMRRGGGGGGAVEEGWRGAAEWLVGRLI